MQLAGVEQLPGTYPFTLERSVKAYRLNHFLHQLIEPRVPAAVPGGSGADVRSGAALRWRSATWCGGATGAGSSITV